MQFYPLKIKRLESCKIMKPSLKRGFLSSYYLMLARYSLGVIPTCFLKTKVKVDMESKQSKSVISANVFFLRISFFASSIFNFK